MLLTKDSFSIGHKPKIYPPSAAWQQAAGSALVVLYLSMSWRHGCAKIQMCFTSCVEEKSL